MKYWGNSLTKTALSLIMLLIGDKMEILEVFDLDGNHIGEQERKSFYAETKAEFLEMGRVSRQVKTIRLMLMNSDGRIYVQKRSKLKNENPGLYDKTIGGHVSKGHSYELTVTKECAEELGFPAAVMPNDQFVQAVSNTDLNIIGLFKEIEVVNSYLSTRISKDGTSFAQSYLSAFFVGYYDGPIKFSDGESSGIEVFSMDELEEDIKNNPQKYTKDLIYFISTYKEYLVPIKKN